MCDFELFMEKEYEMLKDAHFQTSQKITSFFQYALLIFSAPIVLLTAENKPEEILLGTVFTVIGTVGLFVLFYLLQLRAEALLYARNINRIRSHIYTQSGKKVSELDKIKVLMSQDKKPAYGDWSQFGGVVIIMALLDSLYFGYGISKFLKDDIQYMTLWILLSAILFFVVHIVMYIGITCYNENGSSYYKRRIGVDIDGVLNNHEKQFVEIYKKIYNENLNESDIKTLPVSKSGKISLENEHKIFTISNYWEDMPVKENAAYYLNHEICEKLGYQAYVFTWRPWKVICDQENKRCKYDIDDATKNWLSKNKITYKKLIFEKGNVDMPTKMFNYKYKNRYYLSRKYKISYFVEDDLNNAIKLSSVCQYVFLIDHLYNRNDNDCVPYNIIRVNNWQEIYEWIKKLG